MSEPDPRPKAVWSVITVALFFPVLSATFLAVCVVAALTVCLVRRERIPALTLSALAIASASLAVDSFPALSWFLSDRAMVAQGLVGIPAQIDPSLIMSRAMLAYLLFAALNRGAKVAWSGIRANLLLGSLAVVGLGVIGPKLSIHFRDVGVILVVLWGIIMGVNWLVAEKTLKIAQLDQNDSRSLLTGSIALATVLLAISIHSLFDNRPWVTLAESRTVAIYEPSASAQSRDFGTSSDGYGLSRIGLYGDMSTFLERLGYQNTPIASLEMLEAMNPTCVYCPTFTDSISAVESHALQQYLERGGSLIAIAEHTNLESSTDILNPVLSQYGLKIRFDNTNGLWGEGLTGSQAGNGQLSRALKSTPYLTHNRGASIQLSRLNATPLLIGRFWQSDQGDSLYPDRAYLSDGRLSAGDRLGNVVLMAEARAGKGRVFVSGDSSPFLNQNLAYNTHFLVTLFSVMTMPRDADLLSWIPILIGVLVAVILVILFRHENQNRIVLVALCILIVATALLNSSIQTNSNRIPEADWAVVSTAENNVFDRDPFSESATTGLALQMFRSGLLPTLGDWEDLEESPSAIFIINPTIRLGTSELRQLNKCIESGARVVISGDGENDAFVELAERFGFKVTEEPVGSVSNGSLTTFAAWRMKSIPGDAKAIEAGGATFGGTRRQGLGKVTVIADGGFFLSRNLEGETAYDEGNCAFVRDLLGSVNDEK